MLWRSKGDPFNTLITFKMHSSKFYNLKVTPRVLPYKRTLTLLIFFYVKEYIWSWTFSCIREILFGYGWII
jgi:hypothetical protein